MKYLVVYTSKTGNTQKIAMKIFNCLPGKSKDIQRLEELGQDEAEIYFVGFWNDRGTCGSDIMDFLLTLHGKKVALFGTCGMAGNQEYFEQVSNRVAAFIPDDNEYLGSFLCLGKMPPQILEKYKMMQQKEDSSLIRMMITGYERAMLHPDEEDLCAAGDFVEKVLRKERR